MTDASPSRPAKSRTGFALSLKGRALRYLAGREHSRAELQRKLAAFEEAPGQLEAVLDDLQAKDFINEDRVVASLLHRRTARFGGARIRYELQKKGLSGDAITQAVQGLKASELERAREVWQRKFGEPAADASARAKHARFLTARGFSGDVVQRVLRLEASD